MPCRAVRKRVARKPKCIQGSTYSPQCSDLRRGRYRHAELPSLGDGGDVALRRRGLNERAATAAAVAARDRDHRIRPRDSHVSIGATRYTLVVRSISTCISTAPHAYARVNVRRRAARLRHDRTRPGPRGTRKRKVFFRARRGPPNRCVMLHFPTVFFDSADVPATRAIPRRVGVLGDAASGGKFERWLISHLY